MAATAGPSIETFIGREIEGLRRQGWEVAVHGLDGSGSALPAGQAGGAWTRRTDALRAVARRALLLAGRPREAVALLRRAGFVRRLAVAARTSGADLIQAHFAWTTADVAGVAADLAGLPFACSVHAWDVFAQPAARLRLHLAGARAVLACSQAAANAVRAAGVPADRVCVVRHGLPLSDFPFEANLAGRRGVLAVGRLVPKKGFDVLLRACALLLKNGGREVDCELIGDGPERASLERLTGRLGLSRKVRFAGRISSSEVPGRLRTAAVLALPSRRTANGDRDGIANVLTEAMALGTPVVTTTAGAAVELVEDGVSGLLVPPDDPATLAHALAQVLDDSSLASRLAAAGRQAVERQHDDRLTLPELEAALLPLTRRSTSAGTGSTGRAG